MLDIKEISFKKVRLSFDYKSISSMIQCSNFVSISDKSFFSACNCFWNEMKRVEMLKRTYLEDFALSYRNDLLITYKRYENAFSYMFRFCIIASLDKNANRYIQE